MKRWDAMTDDEKLGTQIMIFIAGALGIGGFLFAIFVLHLIPAIYHVAKICFG